MIVKVLTLTGEVHDFDMEPNDKILIIKERLEELEGIPLDQQRLVYQGKRLKDEDTLTTSKIKSGAVIHLVVALRGGVTNVETQTDF